MSQAETCDFFMERKREMTKKEIQIRQVIDSLSCPICEQDVYLDANKSIRCKNHHTFDIAKKGYVNMLTRRVHTQYRKQLFVARKQMIRDSRLYHPLHEQITNIMKEYIGQTTEIQTILDAGCGEGSHFHQMTMPIKQPMKKIGIDVAKEGIMIASSTYKDTAWLVGDLSRTPLKDNTCTIMLNIFSPANYVEFKRILIKNGLIIKVVPRQDYLKELRHAFYAESDQQTNPSDHTTALFKKNFGMKKQIRVCYSTMLGKQELTNLAHMSPLSWNATSEQIDAFIVKQKTAITVDVDILVGKNVNIGGDI